MTTINVVTGAISGPIYPGSQFEWINTGNTVCVVSGVGGWCTQNSYSVPAAISPTSPGRCPATTRTVSGNFGFECPCSEGEFPPIHIGSK